jgi:hypothetical protein
MSYKDLVVHPIVAEMLARGIEPTLTAEGLVLQGFYKSGTVTLVMTQEGKLYLHSRYDHYEKDEITSLRDIVEINIYWWEYSKDRNPNWAVPCEPWATLAVEMGLLKKTVRQVTEYNR